MLTKVAVQEIYRNAKRQREEDVEAAISSDAMEEAIDDIVDSIKAAAEQGHHALRFWFHSDDDEIHIAYGHHSAPNVRIELAAFLHKLDKKHEQHEELLRSARWKFMSALVSFAKEKFSDFRLKGFEEVDGGGDYTISWAD